MSETKSIEKRTKKSVKVNDGEADVLAKIGAMPEPYRAMGERLHAIIRANGPTLSPKTWYGMPGYALEGAVVCFFRSGHGPGERYLTFGFNPSAKLDDGAFWPIAYALTALNDADAERIGALVRRAVG